jgi:hypothetical protein
MDEWNHKGTKNTKESTKIIIDQARGSGGYRVTRRQDWLAIGLIVVGYLVIVLVMPIGRDFALLDDWAYMRSVEKIVGGQGFVPIQFAQATFVTQGYLGAIFLWLFGTSFTAATAATMLMSLTGAIAFYVVLRQLGLTPGMSGLGTAILVLNPYYLYLSYTFMTEIPFVAMMLLTCVFYLKGMKDGGDGWLWVGSIFAALIFLTRQFGIALPVAALLWLWWARKLTLGRAAAVAVLPLAAVVGYEVWSSGFGTTFSGSVGREEILDLRNPVEWLHRAAHFVFFALFLPGLTIPFWGEIRRWRVAVPLAVITAVMVYVLWGAKFGLVSSGSGSLNEISYTWLQHIFSDPTLVYCLGSALTVLLLFSIFESGWPAIAAFVRRRGEIPPAGFFYLAGAILFLGTYVVSAGFLDRYWVPVLPFLIAAGLSALRATELVGRVTRFMRVTIPIMLTLTALFGIIVHLDDYAAVGKSWQAGRWVVAQGVPLEKIENGNGWDGYFLYDESLKSYPSLDVNVVGRNFPPFKLIDPQYVISTQSRDGHSIVQRFPYFSILGGMKQMDVLVLKRD